MTHELRRAMSVHNSSSSSLFVHTATPLLLQTSPSHARSERPKNLCLIPVRVLRRRPPLMSASTELPTTAKNPSDQVSGADDHDHHNAQLLQQPSLVADDTNSHQASVDSSSHATTTTHVSYPEPTGLSLELTKLARAAQSIPDWFTSLADTRPDILALTDEHHPPLLLLSREQQHNTASLTYGELATSVRIFATGLRAIGLRQGQFVSLFSENSSRWLIADLAIMTAGAAAAVRGVDAPVDELIYISTHSGSSALVVEHTNVLTKIIKAGFRPAAMGFIVVLFGGIPTEYSLPNVFSFEQVMAMGAHAPHSSDLVSSNLTRSSIATILYTSGTTGHPKGVALTHGNILAQLDRICIGRLDPLPGEVFVSVLPCWHIFERTAAYYCLSKGMHMVYSNKRHFRDDLVKYRPHILIAVPRVFENLHATIMARIRGARASQRAVFSAFVAISIAFVHVRRSIQGLSLRAPMFTMSFLAKILTFVKFVVLAPLYGLANLLVWKKIRAATGGRVKACVVGGGSVPEYVEDFFEASSIDICVGYGLTETSPVVCNRFAGHNVRGSAGLPLPDTSVRIIDMETRKALDIGQQGEVLVKGPQVFSGYFKNSEATAKAFDSDGYFDTGDLGYVAPDGDIVITGRSKDVIVLSNGENIEPAPIEDAIVSSPLIDQVMLVGQDEKHLCALVVPSLSGLVSEGLLADERRLEIEQLARVGTRDALRQEGDALLMLPGVRNALNAAITQANRSRSNYAVIDLVQDFKILLEPFSVENGMLTQTLKVKRNHVGDAYASDIASLYRK